MRVSSPDRLEIRVVDSMVNPYLMQAALLRTIDDGIRNRIDPGKPEERNFAEVVASDPDAARIPTTLRDALDAVAADPVVRSALPESSITSTTGTSVMNGIGSFGRSPIGI